MQYPKLPDYVLVSLGLLAVLSHYAVVISLLEERCREVGGPEY